VTSSTRIAALDATRGLAALGVVLHHVVLVWIPETRGAYSARTTVITDPIGWLLTYTPLHLPWVGTVNVLVFFALSGFVLVQPLIAAERPGIVRFWGARAVRLYLPAWASLVFALALLAATGVGSLPVDRAVKDALLVPLTVSNEVNGVLWSLAWEVLFSAIVPLLALGIRALGRSVERSGPGRRSACLLIIAIPAATALAAALTDGVAHEVLIFGTVFLGGVAVAGVRRLSARCRSRETTRTAGLAAVVALALASTTRWWLLPFTGSLAALAVADVVTAVAAVLVVLWVVVSLPAQRLLARPLLLSIGGVSFSMYLVHAPVLEALHAVSKGSALAIVPALVVVAVASMTFNRLVERPSHRLAQRVAHGRTGRMWERVL
jgi:peptidoglycan/LPS O-acetylase OafA/YrhL